MVNDEKSLRVNLSLFKFLSCIYFRLREYDKPLAGIPQEPTKDVKKKYQLDACWYLIPWSTHTQFFNIILLQKLMS